MFRDDYRVWKWLWVPLRPVSYTHLGSFYLVTNGGEKEIPYSFRVQNSASGKTLDRLKKVSDFGDMAREDFDMAMRIFEYRDFTRVPFMQDLDVYKRQAWESSTKFIYLM